MNNAVFEFSDAEIKKLKELPIGAVVLFGSQAQNIANNDSDYDFGIILSDKKILSSPEKRSVIYEELYDLLADHINQLTNIDIVFLETAPAELQFHVVKFGQLLYEAHLGAFANYKANVIESYADFALLRNIFERGVLNQIK